MLVQAACAAVRIARMSQLQWQLISSSGTSPFCSLQQLRERLEGKQGLYRGHDTVRSSANKVRAALASLWMGCMMHGLGR